MTADESIPLHRVVLRSATPPTGERSASTAYQVDVGLVKDLAFVPKLGVVLVTAYGRNRKQTTVGMVPLANVKIMLPVQEPQEASGA